MNEIITKLNEIEEKADAIISDAKARKEQMAVQLEADKKAIDAKYDRLEKEAVEEFLGQRQMVAEKQIQEMKEKDAKALERLEASFLQEKEKLADEIFRRIVQ